MQTAEAAATSPAHRVVGGVPPMTTVACDNGDCANFRIRRQVRLRLVAVGVLEWPILHCAGCGFRLDVPWPFDNQEVPMPKIHAHQGPTNYNSDEALAALLEQSATEAGVDLAEVAAPTAEPEETPEAVAEPEPKPRRGKKTVMGTGTAVLDGPVGDG